ncbi:MAG: hypothetical protein P4L86_02820 [Mycobacterium sp.]|nr:hypothetical protein [Mycobacterium sp.]
MTRTDSGGPVSRQALAPWRGWVVGVGKLARERVGLCVGGRVARSECRRQLPVPDRLGRRD